MVRVSFSLYVELIDYTLLELPSLLCRTNTSWTVGSWTDPSWTTDICRLQPILQEPGTDGTGTDGPEADGSGSDSPGNDVAVAHLGTSEYLTGHQTIPDLTGGQPWSGVVFVKPYLTCIYEHDR
jgi:hypothetical protein